MIKRKFAQISFLAVLNKCSAYSPIITVFPFCNPTKSGIADDHCMPYFSNTVGFTNMYAYWKGAGSGYSHEFPPVLIPEMVHWLGVPI